jgi:hypothetical protein
MGSWPKSLETKISWSNPADDILGTHRMLSQEQHRSLLANTTKWKTRIVSVESASVRPAVHPCQRVVGSPP